MRRVGGRRPTVVDTNVLVTANRRQGEPLPCANASAQALLDIKREGILVLDSLGLIVGEYRRYLNLSGQPGVGDSFIKWVFDHRGRQDLVQAVVITPYRTDSEDFTEFPHVPALSRFDASDRKFVAVAVQHGGSPPVLNATDRDWWEFREALKDQGVHVRFLCPERFRRRRYRV